MLRTVLAISALIFSLASAHAQEAPVQLVSGECYTNNFCELLTKDGEEITVSPSQIAQNALYQPLLVSRHFAVVGECSATTCKLFLRSLNLNFEARVLDDTNRPVQARPLVETTMADFMNVMGALGRETMKTLTNRTY